MPILILSFSEDPLQHIAPITKLYYLLSLRAGSNPEVDFPVNAISGSERGHHALYTNPA